MATVTWMFFIQKHAGKMPKQKMQYAQTLG